MALYCPKCNDDKTFMENIESCEIYVCPVCDLTLHYEEVKKEWGGLR